LARHFTCPSVLFMLGGNTGVLQGSCRLGKDATG